MKVLIVDDLRHTQFTGYGALARSVILSLSRFSNVGVMLQQRNFALSPDLPHGAELAALPSQSGIGNVDAILRVGSPNGKNQYGVPTVVFTQNALGALPPDWIETLGKADGLIVPGRFDADVFERHFPRVYVCHQHVDPAVFRPMPHWRAEGDDALTFMFVGSYSYRKGIDVLLKSFVEAFRHDHRKVKLLLNCAAGFWSDSANNLFTHIRDLPAHMTIQVHLEDATPAWMNRYINRVDCVVTMSRGEGWCMPLHEALLCGKPVICPDSTAMGEALPHDGVRRVRTSPMRIADIVEPAGQSHKLQFGANDNVQFEPDFDDAVAAFRDMAARHEHYTAGAAHARTQIAERYSLERMGPILEQALTATLASIG